MLKQKLIEERDKRNNEIRRTKYVGVECASFHIGFQKGWDECVLSLTEMGIIPKEASLSLKDKLEGILSNSTEIRSRSNDPNVYVLAGSIETACEEVLDSNFIK